MVEVIKDAAAKKMESVKAQTLKLIDKCSVYYEKFSAIEKQYGSKPVSEVPKGILKEWKSLRDKFDVTDKKRVEKLLEAIDLFEMAPFKIKWDTRMERIGILNLTDNPFKGTVYDRFAHGRIKK
jgi:hypothetical protein